jgi:predicted metal-dependent hydrolase
VPVVRLGGREVPYRLVRSPLTRRLTTRVTAEGLSVTAPPRLPERRIAAALRADADLLLGALERAAARAPAPLADGVEVPLLDDWLLVETRPGARAARRAGDRLILPAGAAAGPAAERWYRAQARGHLGALVARWAPRVGVAPRRVVVRGQRTRWGSASARGEIALNWRLMLAPEDVGEYVVVHELAHLVHMDHSPAFWAVVAEHLPGHRRQRDWLRTEGPRLAAGPAGVARHPGGRGAVG